MHFFRRASSAEASNEAARNHQMKYTSHRLPSHTNRDAFSDSPYSFHRTTSTLRLEAQQCAEEYARKTHLSSVLAENPLFKRGNISGDVWKLRHGIRVQLSTPAHWQERSSADQLKTVLSMRRVAQPWPQLRKACRRSDLNRRGMQSNKLTSPCRWKVPSRKSYGAAPTRTFAQRSLCSDSFDAPYRPAQRQRLLAPAASYTFRKLKASPSGSRTIGQTTISVLSRGRPPSAAARRPGPHPSDEKMLDRLPPRPEASSQRGSIRRKCPGRE